jgi:hypothetical protein
MRTRNVIALTPPPPDVRATVRCVAITKQEQHNESSVSEEEYEKITAEMRDGA